MKKVLIFLLLILISNVVFATNAQPLEIKVVVVNMFEIGEDEGDRAGEFQLWKAGQKLDSRYPVPHGHHDIFVNEDTGVLGVVTGMGIARAAAAIMALGLDPRFDLTNAYWLVAGIAGIDPLDGTLGTAVWTDYVVDGDLAHEIDGREIPDDWKTGYFPLFTTSPYPNSDEVTPTNSPNGEVYVLNSALSAWAYDLTKDIVLPSTDAMFELAEQYKDFPNALAKPKVMMGDHLAASTFWHGEMLTEWANDWVSYWTNSKGNFVTSGMEDTATLQSLTYLANAHKVDLNRVMILRTASNFTQPPPGITAAQNLENESSGSGYAGLDSAISAAYTVGSPIVNYIVEHWETTKDNLPSN